MLLAAMTLALAQRHPDADRVLLVVNLNSPVSVQIGEDYVKRRGVRNVLQIRCQDSALESGKETMPYADFKAVVEAPFEAYVKKNPRIDFVVLTKGVPIRLTNAPFGVGKNRPSLDSALASFGYSSDPAAIKVELNDSGFTGICWVNKFWNASERFSHKKFGGYLVTRLDGYTVDEAMRLTYSSVQADGKGSKGPFLIDTVGGRPHGDLKRVPQSPSIDGKLDHKVINEMAYGDFDADMIVAAEKLTAKGFEVRLDKEPAFVGFGEKLAGYCSWGSNDPKFSRDGYLGMTFQPGAILETAVSTSARTFLPTQGGQSLIVDLVRQRATGAKGYCDEPLLQAVASPTILFDRYTSGWTLAESYFAASRFVGWEDIVIGDPLCAPYAKGR